MNVLVKMHEWQLKFKNFFLHINCFLKCIVELLFPIQLHKAVVMATAGS
jgi:hypothetical protein